MTKTDYYDYVNDFYMKYTKGMSQEEALLFNSWLTRIRILAPFFEEKIGSVEDNIKNWYNFNIEETDE